MPRGPLLQPPYEIPLAPPWVSAHPTRTTMEIAYSCIFTLILSAWSMLHLGIFSYRIRKSQVRLTMVQGLHAYLALQFPEWTIYNAVQQWIIAWNVINLLEKYDGKYKTYNARHHISEIICQCHLDVEAQSSEKEKLHSLELGFYASMQGFELVGGQDGGPDGKSREMLSADQVVMLRAFGLLPRVPEYSVEDRSKADTVTKLIACSQGLFMVVQVISRKLKGLPVTLLEFDTALHVVCTLIAYVIWFKKPHSVKRPTEIQDIVHLDWINVKVRNNRKMIITQDNNRDPKPPRDSPVVAVVTNLDSIGSEVTEEEIEAEARYATSTPDITTGSDENPKNEKATVTATGIPNTCEWPKNFCRPFLFADKILYGEEALKEAGLTYLKFVGERQDNKEIHWELHKNQKAKPIKEHQHKVTGILLNEKSASPVFIGIRNANFSFVWAHILASYCLDSASRTVGHNQITWKQYQEILKETQFVRSLSRKIQSSILLDPRQKSFRWTQEKRWLAPTLATLLYSAFALLHAATWNSYFPTLLERYLWRVASLAAAAFMPCAMATTYIMCISGKHKRWMEKKWQKWPKLSFKEKALLIGPGCIWAIVLATCVIVCMCSLTAIGWARLYFVAEGFASLRSLPQGAYTNVRWLDFWPHL